MPSASVIMAVYNAERYLEEAIDSVLSQSFTDFELLLLNDGSTDNSLDILQGYTEKNARCKLYSFQNMGRAKVRNEGIKHAKGEILFIMDADDVCLPNRFQVQIDFLKENPDCVVVGSKVLLIDPEGSPLCELIDLFHSSEIDGAHMASKGEGSRLFHPSAAIIKEAFWKVGGYRAEYPYAQDMDLFLRMAEIGKLANIPEVLLKYRQHLGSAGYQKRKEQISLAYKAVKDAHQRRGLEWEESKNADSKLKKSSSLSEIHRKWGWWALRGGNIPTARKHAFKSFFLAPWCLESYRILFCSLRGY